MTSLRLARLLLAALAVSALYAAPIVVNGSLTGPITNGGIPPGWTLLSGSPDTMDQNNNVGVPGDVQFVAAPVGPSPDGGTWVGFGREGDGFIERFGQSLSGFTIGAQYTVSWYFGNFGYSGTTPAYSGDQGIEVLLDGVSVGSSGLLGPGRTWVAQSLIFTATSGTHQLQFQPVSGNKSYISIDGISLAGTETGVPEPATSALMAAGLAAAVFGRRFLSQRNS